MFAEDSTLQAKSALLEFGRLACHRKTFISAIKAVQSLSCTLPPIKQATKLQKQEFGNKYVGQACHSKQDK